MMSRIARMMSSAAACATAVTISAPLVLAPAAAAAAPVVFNRPDLVAEQPGTTYLTLANGPVFFGSVRNASFVASKASIAKVSFSPVAKVFINGKQLYLTIPSRPEVWARRQCRLWVLATPPRSSGI